MKYLDFYKDNKEDRDKQKHILTDVTYALFGTLYTEAMAAAFKQYKIKVGSGIRILEAGCGHGKFTYFWSQFGCDCWGIDVDNKQVDYCRKLAGICDKVSGRMGYYAFKEGDIRNMPEWEDNHFDIVFNEGVLEHFSKENQREAIQEMVRVSKKLVIIFVPNAGDKRAVDFAETARHHSYAGKGGMGLTEKPFKSHELYDLMYDAGLKDINIAHVEMYLMGVGRK